MNLLSSALVAPPIGWQKCPPEGLGAGGHVWGLNGSFALPPFIPSEQPGGTFPEELQGGAVPLPLNEGIHPGISQHPYATPFP